jgi:hypothetical protein
MSSQDKSPLVNRTINQLTNNDNFSTPYRQERSNKDIYKFKLLSSGKTNKTENHNCLNNFCQCPIIDNLLKKMAMSPSTNFLFQSPTSLNNYVESLTKAKITIITNNVVDTKPNNDVTTTNTNNINTESPKSIDDINVEKPETKININLFNDSNIKTRISKTESKYSLKNTPRNLWEDLNEINNSLNLFLSDDEDINNETKSNILGSKRQLYFSDSICESPCKVNQDKSKELSQSTSILFNTEKSKKFKKRNRKSNEQIQNLKELYDKNKNKDWSKEEIQEVALKTGLNKNRVYKWLWDKKNKELLLKKDKFMIVTDY